MCHCCCHGGPQHHFHGDWGHFPRRFFAKEERVAKLQEYIADLKSEIKAAEEELERMQNQKDE